MANHFIHKGKRVYLLDDKRGNVKDALISLREWTYELESMILDEEYNKTTEWEDFLLRLAFITHPHGGSFDEPDCPSEWITELLTTIDKWAYIHDGTSQEDAFRRYPVWLAKKIWKAK